MNAEHTIIERVVIKTISEEASDVSFKLRANGFSVTTEFPAIGKTRVVGERTLTTIEVGEHAKLNEGEESPW